jgi:hypothetical protein
MPPDSRRQGTIASIDRMSSAAAAARTYELIAVIAMSWDTVDY